MTQKIMHIKQSTYVIHSVLEVFSLWDSEAQEANKQ